MTKRVTIRLYRRHDIDLIALKCANGFSMNQMIRESLLAYLNGKSSSIDYPAIEIPMSNLPQMTQLHLILDLDYQDDARIYKYISSIQPGYRNSIVKQLIRYYCVSPRLFEMIYVNGSNVVKITPEQ